MRLLCRLLGHKWWLVHFDFELGVMWECVRCNKVHIAPFVPWNFGRVTVTEVGHWKEEKET